MRIADWMQKHDGANEQVADVLGALQREQDDHRQELLTQLLPLIFVLDCAFAPIMYSSVTYVLHFVLRVANVASFA